MGPMKCAMNSRNTPHLGTVYFKCRSNWLRRSILLMIRRRRSIRLTMSKQADERQYSIRDVPFAPILTKCAGSRELYPVQVAANVTELNAGLDRASFVAGLCHPNITGSGICRRI